MHPDRRDMTPLNGDWLQPLGTAHRDQHAPDAFPNNAAMPERLGREIRAHHW